MLGSALATHHRQTAEHQERSHGHSSRGIVYSRSVKEGEKSRATFSGYRLTANDSSEGVFKGDSIESGRYDSGIYS